MPGNFSLNCISREKTSHNKTKEKQIICILKQPTGSQICTSWISAISNTDKTTDVNEPGCAKELGTNSKGIFPMEKNQGPVK